MSDGQTLNKKHGFTWSGFFANKYVETLLAAALFSLITTLIPGGWTTVGRWIVAAWSWVTARVLVPVWAIVLVLAVTAFTLWIVCKRHLNPI